MQQSDWGRIMRALGGFYYVKTEEGTMHECRARGIFRKDGISPLVGDRVRILITGEGTGSVEEIGPRRNFLIRPPVANLDKLVLVASVVSPPPNLRVLDKLIAIAEHKDIEPVLAVTKTDLCGEPESRALCALYAAAGFQVFPVSAVTGEGAQELARSLAGCISSFCGNTGAGKSSLLNVLDPTLALETGEISQKLGRGRHTTRHAALYELPGGGIIADTPGFSAVELQKYEVIKKDALEFCFREFEAYRGRCRYAGCTHVREEGCAVLEAGRAGLIAESRLQSYRALYEEAKGIKDWELTAPRR